jgi:hypothetical protein
MLIEKTIIQPLVERFIENNCDIFHTTEEEKIKLKSYLKKDEHNCFTIYDKEHSIKCIFDREFLNNYLSEHASHMKFDNFDSKLKIK